MGERGRRRKKISSLALLFPPIIFGQKIIAAAAQHRRVEAQCATFPGKEEILCASPVAIDDFFLFRPPPFGEIDGA